ncbi:thiamine phosphate synthase [Rheinheimera sp.]|uniref:thiamine phosphate synthase n=1 Tax=Rheinheimera sp. TaxID=1869214 RepID=UPI002FDCBB4A
MSNKVIVWCIGGSDSGGGAGIQADLLTVTDLTGHGCTVITAVTAQNSVAVTDVFALSAEVLCSQLHALWQDLPPAAIKIGMLADDAQLEALALWLATHQPQCPVIWDPVLIASTGRCLSDISRQACLALLQQVQLLTPNLPELAYFAKVQQQANSADCEEASAQLLVLRTFYQGAILLKAGHAAPNENNNIVDLFVPSTAQSPVAQSPAEQSTIKLYSNRLNSPHQHGTGCTLASAIAALWAQNYDLIDAIVLGRAYLQQSLRAGYATGQGAGTLARLGWPLQQQDFPALYPAPVKATKGATAPVSLALLQSSAPIFPRLSQCIGLYPVLDDISWLKRLLPLGLHIVQLRLKNKTEQELRAQISAAVEFCRDYQIQLFINDHWQLAIEYQAYGVHLGQEDLQEADLAAIAGAGLRLGVSTHGYAELAAVLPLKPSYIALGHIFPTQTKQMPSQPQGLKRLADYVWLCDEIPTVAIGGIAEHNISAVLQTGVRGVAVVSAITKAAQPEQALKQLQSYCQTLYPPFSEVRHGFAGHSGSTLCR